MQILLTYVGSFTGNEEDVSKFPTEEIIQKDISCSWF